jgi:predicted secreted Zn-dependent protease
VSIQLDIEYTMPEWQVAQTASPELEAAWQTYLDALWCHEYGHTDIALTGANDAFDTLTMILEQEGCADGADLAQMAFDEILDVAREQGDAYDEETIHGETMGAVFP